MRWIGGPDADEPAPQVALTAAEEDHGGGTAHDPGEAEADETAAASTAAASASGENGPSTGLVIVALALGAFGVALGSVGLLASRRKAA